MIRWQYALGVDRKCGAYSEPIHQLARLVGCILGAATEHDEGARSALQHRRGVHDGLRAGSGAIAFADFGQVFGRHRRGDDIQRQFDVYRTGAGAVEYGKGTCQYFGQFTGARDGVAENGDTGNELALAG